MGWVTFARSLAPKTGHFYVIEIKQGAAGVHLFNHGYISHRQGPVVEGESLKGLTVGAPWTGRFTEGDPQTLSDLGDPKGLAGMDRCYYADTRSMNCHGDHAPQVPFKLSLKGRGAGPAHAIQIRVEDDIAAGQAERRIKKTELRLQLTNTQKSFHRIRCVVNGKPVDLASAGRIRNQRGDEWVVVDDPPVQNGINTVLVFLEGMKTPAEYTQRGDPWPSLESCEILVRTSL